ncbi:MAG: ABC transporter permease, partial [Firmicutes bacterium]|nr:ABC transporter permease [Bacillota bacterium]
MSNMTAENGITLPNQNTEGPQPSEAVETAHRVEVASQWKLMWWKFRKHKLAMVAGVVVICIYLIAMFADFLAPYPSDKYSARYTYAPPQRLHFFLRTEDGLKFQPHVHGYISKVDPVALRRSFTIDESNIIPVGFFVKGEPYKLWNIFELDRRLIGPKDGRSPMYLFGADRMGRDIFSRVIYGTRVSMTIGLVGVTISLV